MLIRTPKHSEFLAICTFIEAFELDNRALLKDEFLAAFEGDELLGFGRIRRRKNCLELCSLGVITPHRLQGIGHALTKALLATCKEPVYLVCILPDFFSPLGFEVVSEFPDDMLEKKNYCELELSVPEEYLVMRRKN